MIDFVSRRWFFFLVSAILIVPGAISLVLPGGLNPGIDFTSGSMMTLRFEQPVEQDQLRHALADLGHGETIIVHSGSDYLVRTFTLAGEVRDASGEILQPSERQTLERALFNRFGGVTVLEFDSVSPLVATEIAQKAVAGVGAACVGILVYLAFAFRNVLHPWRYGACAVIALVHDALVLLGTFSILGRVFHTELDALFITAMLAVIGFSVHDTIVVFDRIRENLISRPGEVFEAVVNHSLTQTIGRSLITSITLLLVMVAMLLFGGATIRPFILAMLIGVTSGTYSSIFNASMLLSVWESGEIGRLFGRARILQQLGG